MIHPATNSSLFSGGTVVGGGTFTQNVYGSSGKGGFERLERACAPAAFHNSQERFDPPKCHPNTRVAVLKRITDWVLGTNALPRERRTFMMWLYGAAGAGKSAIAQTIAEQFQDEGSLLASFFFSRTDPTRNCTRNLVATIAYQVAVNIPQAKAHIVSAVEHDPLLFSKSLKTQFSHLIFEPLLSYTGENHPDQSSAYLIIIDGLDECQDRTRCDILRVLTTALREGLLPPLLRVLILSRSELDIRTFIDSQSLETSPHRLGLDNSSSSDDDICLFLQDKFNEIKLHHPHRSYIPIEWPGQSVIDYLVKNSSGHFIYASTVAKYISSEAHKPTNRLGVILGFRPARHEAPFAALDELYRHIFSTVQDPQILQVLGLVILGQDPRTHILEITLGLDPGDINVMFSTLESIVQLEWNKYVGTEYIKILQASLEDFLLDESRSKEFYIYPAKRHAEYAHMLFRHISITDADKFETFPSEEFLSCFVSLKGHLQKALHTDELHQDIVRFNLGRAYHKLWKKIGNENYRNIHSYFSRFVTHFLLWIKASEWEDRDELHASQQRHFDQLLINSLETYYTSPALTFLLASVFLDEEPLVYTSTLVNQSETDIDRRDLCLLPQKYRYTFTTSIKNWDYELYLRQFLDDSTRCGQHALTDKRYAIAALYLYRLICEPTGGVFTTFIPESAAKVLQLLVKLLDRAGKSASLLSFTRDRNNKRNFVSAISHHSNNYSKEAQQAVDDYTSRMKADRC